MFELGRFVYHYTSACVASEHILRSMSLRVGPFERVNDPRESKVWPFKFYARTGTQVFDSSLFHEATKHIAKRTLVLCCSGDDPTGTDDSLRMGFARPRMWAQYGEAHRGVCLVLDREELNRSVAAVAAGRMLFSGEVEYLDSSSGPSVSGTDPYGLVYLEDVQRDGLAAVLDMHVDRFHRQLFFTKHEDWRHEHEHRWVLRAADEPAEFIPISHALRAVLLGADCSATRQDEIVETCRPHGIAVHRLYWHGWAVSVFGNLLEPPPAEAISFNGLYFSQRIPCSVIYSQVCDQLGRVRTISIDTNGHVKLVS